MKAVFKETERLATRPILASLRSTGVCSVSALHVLDSWVRVRISGITVLSSSKQAKYSTTGVLADILTHSADLYADVASRWDCQGYYGYDKWFAGHRNGATGLAHPNTPDIRFYRESVEWIKGQIDSDPKYKSDDTRFWVDVTPI